MANKNPSPKASEESVAGFFSGFSSYAHLLRFCLVLTYGAALAGIIIWLITSKLSPKQQVKVDFKESSTLISINNEPKKALVVVPASQLWIDSGLELKPGQKINVSASGAINLSVHRLVEAAQNTTRPRHGWTTPIGENERDLRCIDRKRRPLLIAPKAAYGSLLAYVNPANAEVPSAKNPIPAGIQVVSQPNSSLVYSNTTNVAGRLFFTINDIVLKDDPEYRKDYITDQKCLDDSYGQNPRRTVEDMEKRWDQLTKNNYWDIWFDDNIGEFLVQISYD
jgi:hypothetical protein